MNPLDVFESDLIFCIKEGTEIWLTEAFPGSANPTGQVAWTGPSEATKRVFYEQADNVTINSTPDHYIFKLPDNPKNWKFVAVRRENIIRMTKGQYDKLIADGYYYKDVDG